MKVLLSAYACEPHKGSEPGVGWNWALQAARSHEVWVLTRANNRSSIEAALVDRPNPNLHFVYHDLPRWTRWWKRGGRGVRLYYYLWQLSILPLALATHRRQRFDIIHHVTFNAVDSPGLLWLLGPKFIWGPVGGAQIPPAELKSYFGNQWWKEQLRALRKRMLRFDPLIRLTTLKAAMVLAANRDAERLLRSFGAKSILRMLEAGVTLPPVDDAEVVDDPFIIVWAGQLVHRKAPLLALDVLKRLVEAGADVELHMAGDGPLRSVIEASIRKYGLENRAKLLGEIPHADMLDTYRRGRVFLFTSLQDTSGNVVLEAMARSLPVVALNHQGVAEMVPFRSGLLVDIATPEQVVAGMASAIQRLVESSELASKLGKGARSHVELHHVWDRKGDLLQTLYSEIVA